MTNARKQCLQYNMKSIKACLTGRVRRSVRHAIVPHTQGLSWRRQEKQDLSYVKASYSTAAADSPEIEGNGVVAGIKILDLSRVLAVLLQP